MEQGTEARLPTHEPEGITEWHRRPVCVEKARGSVEVRGQAQPRFKTDRYHYVGVVLALDQPDRSVDWHEGPRTSWRTDGQGPLVRQVVMGQGTRSSGNSTR